MPWVRLDDEFPTHRKVRRISDAAFRLHVSGLCWASKYLTNGHIPADDLDLIADLDDGADPQTWTDAAEILVRRRMWHLAEHDCPTCPTADNGWIIHDFLDVNPSADQVRKQREQAAERQRRSRERRRESHGDDDDMTADESRVTNASSHARVTEPPAPTPTHTQAQENGSLRSPSSSEIGDADPDAAKPEPIRDDVERLCTHLADRIESNGAKRPSINKGWRDAARLMLDRDKRTEDQVHHAIDWCQGDEFWRANVLSMPKLREKYDQLSLQAQRQRAPNGVLSRRQQADNELFDRAMQRATAREESASDPP